MTSALLAYFRNKFRFAVYIFPFSRWADILITLRADNCLGVIFTSALRRPISCVHRARTFASLEETTVIGDRAVNYS